MILRALDEGVPAGWVAADQVYGGNPTLCGDLEKRQVGYVLAVACDHRVTTATGTHRADEPLRLPKPAWQRLSAGKGAKGHRFSVSFTTLHVVGLWANDPYRRNPSLH